MIESSKKRWLGKKNKNIHQMVVTNGDESHGIESVKDHQLNKSMSWEFQGTPGLPIASSSPQEIAGLIWGLLRENDGY